MAQSPLSDLSEAERALAFERFELLRPALEEEVPLAQVARVRGIALRTVRRWVVDPGIEPTAWIELTTRANPETVTFADRRLERAWQRRVLGYEEVVAPGAV
jgi:hypothetical protein